MKPMLIATILAAAAFAAAPLHAQSQPEPEEEARSRAKAEQKEEDRFCVQQTGSRVIAARNMRSRSDEKECINGGGTVYTRADIERSGSIDVKDALRRLDPRIR